MGFCCCKEKVYYNKAEKFINEIIYSMKLNELTFNQFDNILKEVFETKEVKGKLTKEIKFFKFKNIVDQYFIEKGYENDLLKFQRNIIIDFRQTDFEYYLYVWALPYLKGDKISFVYNILNKKANEITLELLIDLIELHLKNTLLNITHKTRELAHKNKNKIYSVLIDNTLIEELDVLAHSLFNPNTISLYWHYIIEDLSSIKRNGKFLDHEFFKIFQNKCEYLFDFYQIRTDFINRFKK